MKLSLGTREPRIAFLFARILAYLGARLLDDSLGGTVRYDEIRALLKDHFTRLLDQKKEAIGVNGRKAHQDFDLDAVYETEFADFFMDIHNIFLNSISNFFRMFQNSTSNLCTEDRCAWLYLDHRQPGSRQASLFQFWSSSNARRTANASSSWL
ncbi:MAG TPA: hypothetical protein EYQ81_06990 [Sneathiellales bacterium]|nr:hypothetical protein [Sneathiellales bacterium]